MMKYIHKYLLAALCLLCAFGGSANPLFPSDISTIEALIELHKEVAKQQSRAVARIGKSTESQLLIKEGAGKVEDNNSTMQSKMTNVHSWTLLAGTLTQVAQELTSLISECKEFQTTTFGAFKKNPSTLWYYYKSNEELVQEIKRARSIFMGLGASATGIMHATMEEKLKISYKVVDIVANARRIIRRAGIYVTTMVPHEPINLTGKSLLSDETKKQLIQTTVSIWKSSK